MKTDKDPKATAAAAATTTTGSLNSLEVDGEDFDIANLLGALPSERPDGEARDRSLSPMAPSTRITRSGKPKRESLRKYPSITGLLNRNSVHQLPPSFLAKTDSPFMTTVGLSGESGHPESPGRNQGSPRRRRSSNLTSLSRHSWMSSMSSLTCSFHHDMPGLSELNESVSSFSDSYEVNEADALAEQHQEIEISPGVFLPFRASDETWEAIKDGQYLTLMCWDCSLELLVSKVSTHVICPDCHTVNPNSSSDDGTKNDEQQHGISMGFKKEWCWEYYNGNDKDNDSK